MAPKNKFTKEEMTAAALRVVRAKGIAGLTAKTMADDEVRVFTVCPLLEMTSLLGVDLFRLI